MNKTNVMIVDDEVNITKFLRANLEAQGYQVSTAINGASALEIFEKEHPDLVILDIGMPDMDGFEVCRRLREWSHIPVIMLSGRRDEKDKVKSLELGADDYITKPVGSNELVARVRAVLRRVAKGKSSVSRTPFKFKNFEINFAEQYVTANGKKVRLTPTEYTLLQELTLNAGKILTHSYLLNKVWGPEYETDREYLHIFIHRLRTKLQSNTRDGDLIETVPGVGYQFVRK